MNMAEIEELKKQLNEISKKIQMLSVESEPNIKYYLNIELPQFSLGKTKKTLDYLREYHYGKSMNNNLNNHIITILITNNSLLETEAWKKRTGNKFKYTWCGGKMNVDILSSKKTSKYTKIQEFEGVLFSNGSVERKKYLPNIVIMCNNPYRVERDMKDLFRCFKNWNNTNFTFTFNFVFDEIDKPQNLTQFTKFHKIIQEYEVSNIQDIILITATPTSNIFNLEKKLINIDNKLKNIIKDDRTQLNLNYRSFMDHKHIIIEGDMDPIKYIIKTITNDSSLLYKDKPNIIFAPSKIWTRTHDDMGNIPYFKEQGYVTLILNGKFKGFIDEDGNKETIEEFNMFHLCKDDYKNGIEIRDTLRKWKLLNPDTNLLITGNYILERGLTFCTNGFNFTHMFISEYHAKNISHLVQLVGRACGNKKYADECTIICPKMVYKSATKYITNIMSLKDAKMEVYTKEDFNNESNTRNFLQSYELHYRIFNNIIKAREYAKVLDLRPRNRKIVTNENGDEFYKDSLNTNKTLVRTFEEVIHRLKGNINRKVGTKTQKKARTNWMFGYENPPKKIGNDLIGGDNKSLRIIVPIPEEKMIETIRVKGINKSLIVYLDSIHNITTKQKCTIISKKNRDDLVKDIRAKTDTGSEMWETDRGAPIYTINIKNVVSDYVGSNENTNAIIEPSESSDEEWGAGSTAS